MKRAETIGNLFGLAGAVWLAIEGGLQANGHGAGTSEYHNGAIELRHGLLFAAFFLITWGLMKKGLWKTCVFIGILSTGFSVLGLFSIGPYLIWGSLFVLGFSSIKAMKSSMHGER
ncbi:hypothetical protein [Cohnella sp. AR92]|uniref:hypothetical protein n=1 Tax=Cohnella sp. AR92 TaxID=648716 RepID=UPI000F8E71AC|nr:hypothetical protein [Cohnella sp. AR92]RUS48166.1 hypothetical protein ELR57_06435 [Cohnella sp. AR92]